ncbi:unnamed protein product [Prorocentrum cordatum]|uniref:Uncharacterized protein n=1 Tax=Prorocentrum cordatum TaxID=2364126 RepID=A0ABN9XEN4_9DINO|nr:unnamed protein product [Polarella glacialis]
MKPPLLGAWARVLAGALLAAAPGAAATDGAQPRPADFFTDDAERMDELPAPQSTSTDACHPKCVWRCHNETCDTSCRPQCQAPKCVTSCKKIRRGVRPAALRGRVPALLREAHMPRVPDGLQRAGECKLDCGQANNCESKCEDPLCSFECRPEECPEPKCVLEDPHEGLQHLGLATLE